MGTLFIVSTPIGNLDDLTRRAEATLAAADRILAEDTRRARVLLAHVGVRTRLTSLHAHNEAARIDRLLGWLDAGERIALVSDAGTPLLSDPGERAVAAAIEAGHEVVPVPGASAALAALVVSGLRGETFLFLGFVPRKGADRRRLLSRVAEAEDTVVLFESPRRLGALLGELREACGPDRRAVVARELTKLHEEIVRGSLSELAERYSSEVPRGEVTLLVESAGADVAVAVEEGEDARAFARELLEAGARPSDAARLLAGRTGLPRNRAYALVHEVGSDE